MMTERSFMKKIIALSNNKGGEGKVHAAITLTGALVKKGYAVYYMSFTGILLRRLENG